MPEQPSPELLAAMEAFAPPSQERLNVVRAAAATLRDTTAYIAELEERLAAANRRKNVLQYETLPTLMDTVGIDRLGLPAQGNMPACDLILQPYIRANIAANWNQDRRTAAFDALTDIGSEDLIKTELKVSLPRGDHELARTIAAALHEQFSVSPEILESVHHQTLTAWLTDCLENGQPLPDLEAIGATVGRIAKLKSRDE